MTDLASTIPRLISKDDYKMLVDELAKAASRSIDSPNTEDLHVSDDILTIAIRRCDTYGPSLINELLALADKQCVADAVELITDDRNLDRFQGPEDFSRELTARALALEAQEIAYGRH